MPRISLNSLAFDIEDPIIPYMVAASGEAFRLQGTQRRRDNIKITRFPFLNWDIDGIGHASISRDKIPDRPSGRMADADADTSHPNGLTLPHAAQSVANPDPDDTSSSSSTDAILDSWVTIFSELAGIFRDTGGTDEYKDIRVRLYQAGSDTWTLGNRIRSKATNDSAVAAFDSTRHKSFHAIITGVETGSGTVDASYAVYTQQTFAESWVLRTNQPAADALLIDHTGSTDYLKGVPSNNGYPMAFLLDAPAPVGREDLIAAIEEHPGASGGGSLQTRIYHTADVGNSAWTYTGAVSGKPRGKGLWANPFSTTKEQFPIIATTTNVYVVDTANSQTSPIFSNEVLGGADDDGFISVGANGLLYVATAQGDLFEVTQPEQGAGAPAVRNIGPSTRTANGGDGLTAERRGPITAMVATPGFLYVAIQGASNSHIVKLNYDNKSWHSVYVAANTNKIYRMIYSNRDDGTGRLHIAVDGGSAISLLQFERPDDSLATVTAPTEATGYVLLAKEDFGDPHASAAVVQAVLAGDDLSGSTSGEYVTLKDGIDGEAATTNNRGNFLSGDLDLLYALGAGVAAKTWQGRLEMTRDGGTNTDTVKIRDFEIQARNKNSTLNGQQIRVNIAATAALRRPLGTAKSVVDDIIAIKDSVINVAYKADTSYGTMYVELVSMSPASLDHATASQVDDLLRASGGIVTLSLEEVL
jgi:hypothetical protein